MYNHLLYFTGIRAFTLKYDIFTTSPIQLVLMSIYSDDDVIVINLKNI